MKEFNQYTVQELKDLHEAMAKVIALREGEKKEAEIVPAGPLSKLPKLGDKVWIAQPNGSVDLCEYAEEYDDALLFEAGRMFDCDTPGKAGAELRVQKGIAPPLPQNHKAGFLGLVEVVGNKSCHCFGNGHKGAAFDVLYDPTQYRRENKYPKGTIVMIDKDGESYFLKPSDYKFI